MDKIHDISSIKFFFPVSPISEWILGFIKVIYETKLILHVMLWFSALKLLVFRKKKDIL